MHVQVVRYFFTSLFYLFIALSFISFLCFRFHDDFSIVVMKVIFYFLYTLFFMVSVFLLSLVFILFLIVLSVCLQFIREITIFRNMRVLFKIFMFIYFLVVLGFVSLEDLSKFIYSFVTSLYFILLGFISLIFNSIPSFDDVEKVWKFIFLAIAKVIFRTIFFIFPGFEEILEGIIGSWSIPWNTPGYPSRWAMTVCINIFLYLAYLYFDARYLYAIFVKNFVFEFILKDVNTIFLFGILVILVLGILYYIFVRKKVSTAFLLWFILLILILVSVLVYNHSCYLHFSHFLASGIVFVSFHIGNPYYSYFSNKRARLLYIKRKESDERIKRILEERYEKYKNLNKK